MRSKRYQHPRIIEVSFKTGRWAKPGGLDADAEPVAHRLIGRAKAELRPDCVWLEPWCEECEDQAWFRERSERQWAEDDVWGQCTDYPHFACRAQSIAYAPTGAGSAGS